MTTFESQYFSTQNQIKTYSNYMVNLLNLVNTFGSSTGDAQDLSLVIYSDALGTGLSFNNIDMHSYSEVIEFNFTAIPCNEYLVMRMTRRAEHQETRVHAFRYECSTLGMKQSSFRLQNQDYLLAGRSSKEVQNFSLSSDMFDWSEKSSGIKWGFDIKYVNDLIVQQSVAFIKTKVMEQTLGYKQDKLVLMLTTYSQQMTQQHSFVNIES